MLSQSIVNTCTLHTSCLIKCWSMLSIRHPARVTLHNCRGVITCAFCAVCEGKEWIILPLSLVPRRSFLAHTNWREISWRHRMAYRRWRWRHRPGMPFVDVTTFRSKSSRVSGRRTLLGASIPYPVAIFFLSSWKHRILNYDHLLLFAIEIGSVTPSDLRGKINFHLPKREIQVPSVFSAISV